MALGGGPRCRRHRPAAFPPYRAPTRTSGPGSSRHVSDPGVQRRRHHHHGHDVRHLRHDFSDPAALAIRRSFDAARRRRRAALGLSRVLSRLHTIRPAGGTHWGEADDRHRHRTDRLRIARACDNRCWHADGAGPDRTDDGWRRDGSQYWSTLWNRGWQRRSRAGGHGVGTDQRRPDGRSNLGCRSVGQRVRAAPRRPRGFSRGDAGRGRCAAWRRARGIRDGEMIARISGARRWVRTRDPVRSLVREGFHADARLLRRGLLDNGYAELTTTRDQARADAERAETAAERLGATVTPSMLTAFAAEARRRMRTEAGGYRRDHLRALAQRVEVGQREVRIIGSKTELLRTLTASAGGKSAAFGVRSFIPKWRPVGDSNPCCRRERAVSWASRRTGPGRARFLRQVWGGRKLHDLVSEPAGCARVAGRLQDQQARPGPRRPPAAAARSCPSRPPRRRSACLQARSAGYRRFAPGRAG